MYQQPIDVSKVWCWKIYYGCHSLSADASDAIMSGIEWGSDEWIIKNLTLTGECNSNSVDDLYEYLDYERPMEYYDLNGIRVYPDEGLSPGIYIRRQGSKAEKFIVK